MKRTHFKVIVLACIVAAGITGCNSTPKQKAEKVENAQANVVDAKQDLEQSRVDSTNEYIKYKTESDAKLKANDVKIAKLKAKVAAENKAIRADYVSKLNILEQKNAKLRDNMQNYKEGNKTDWEKFKSSFNHEMDELGQSITKLADKNKQ